MDWPICSLVHFWPSSASLSAVFSLHTWCFHFYCNSNLKRTRLIYESLFQVPVGRDFFRLCNDQVGSRLLVSYSGDVSLRLYPHVWHHRAGHYRSDDLYPADRKSTRLNSSHVA